jgi:hypothetical protein
MRPKKILIACEKSGKVRDAFIRQGHDAISCDLRPSDSDQGPHLQKDVTLVLREEWDLVVAHPPCTYLCNSGVRWLYTQPDRWRLMHLAARFFVACLNANAEMVCVENPIPHGYAMDIIKQEYSQIVQPWQYGHGETKATCLWLKGLPLLVMTNEVSGRTARIHKMAPGPNRSMLRSETYKGIADAMASQWGALNTMVSGFTSANKRMVAEAAQITS